MKLCIDCIYFQPNEESLETGSKCLHVKSTRLHPVTGRQIFQYADLFRNHGCGEEAIYWSDSYGGL